MFCDLTLPDGTPSMADPRHVLQRALTKASDQGFTFYTHPEIEFFLLKQGVAARPAPRADRPVRLLRPRAHGNSHDFRRAAISMLEAMGISVEFSHHEAPRAERDRPALRRRPVDGRQHHDLPGGHQGGRPRAGHLRLLHAQAVRRAPRLGHAHPPLAFEGDTNAFHEPGALYQLSKTVRQFIAGLLQHGAEITAVTNQWVNSYKRPGRGEAPAHLTWGHNNRSALVRVPMYKPTKGNSSRVEVRSIDTACNPYLASPCCSRPA